MPRWLTPRAAHPRMSSATRTSVDVTLKLPAVSATQDDRGTEKRSIASPIRGRVRARTAAGMPSPRASAGRMGGSASATASAAAVAECPRLRAVPIDGDRRPVERLADEIGDHAAVGGIAARAVGVEDSNDAHVHVMLSAIGHGQCLTEALALVVAGANAIR